MKKVLFLATFFALCAVAGFSAVITSADFTAAQVDTMPANMVSEWNTGTNAAVKPLADATIAIPVDHAAPNDGYVLRLYDQGGYNFAYPTDYATLVTKTDTTVEALIYVNLANAGTSEKDFGLGIRVGIDSAPELGGRAMYNQMSGYWFWVTANSSWSGITPTAKRPFILKKSSGTWTLVGTEGTADVADGWHKFTLTAVGSTISGYIDDVKVVEGTDTEYAAGFGCAAFYFDGTDQAGGYDNFVWSDAVSSEAHWNLY